ncbi:MAG: transposase [Candidatus Kuenenbacteria bacterium]
MSKRDYKNSGENNYFHIFNRGNNNQNIFLNKEDYEFFILKIKQNIFPDKNLKRMNPLPYGSFSLLSYCLMPNHFHLLLKQNNKYTAQQLLLRICTSYSKYFNKKYKRVGHIFQDRFKQVDIDDDEQLLWLHAYINLNPALDKIIDQPEKYKWSSYNEFLNNQDGLCDKNFINEKFIKIIAFEKFLKDAFPLLKINKELRKFKFE